MTRSMNPMDITAAKSRYCPAANRGIILSPSQRRELGYGKPSNAFGGSSDRLCGSSLLAHARSQLSPVPAECSWGPAVKDPFADVRERQQREAQLRSAEMVGLGKKPDTRDLEAAAKQMSEDFKGIQVMRNNVVRHLLSQKPLDYKFIASETERINKRANRMKAHLTRESVEGEKKA